MKPRHVHVVGAGVAGLSAALDLVAAGVGVTVHEAGPAAGGRCRSYFDRELGCRVDNGNHLVLSGNQAVWAFLDRVGARGTMGGPAEPVFPFMDLGNGECWTVRPNRGRVPWWALSRRRQVPGARLSEFLPVLALRRAGPEATVEQTLGAPGRRGELYRRLLEPLAISALNTPVETASARLLGAVVAQSLGAGGAACIPAFPREGLSESFIDPAVAWLEARGAQVLTGRRVGTLAVEDGRAVRLGEQVLGADEAVVLAVPAPVAAGLLPGLTVPDRFEAILNLHYRVDAEPGEAGFMGLVGGMAEWVFMKPGIVSVTVSAANRLADEPAEALAATVWAEVRAALRLNGDMPAWRVVREKRATFAATPAQDRRRPSVRIGIHNLALAGDWTATGLPATIEGAIRSGTAAAHALLRG